MIIDTHAHLEMKKFEIDRDGAILRARTAGVEIIINPGIDLEGSLGAVALTKNRPGIFAAVGVHPENVEKYFEEKNDPSGTNPRKIKVDVRVELEKLAKNKKVVAIGECGLDYKSIREKLNDSRSRSAPAGQTPGVYDYLEKEMQKDIFRRQLGTAVLTNLPVIIHNREADGDVIDEISRYKETKKLRGVFHCFTGSLEFAKKVLNLGFLISFTGIITYPKNDELRDVVKDLPLDKITVETDSPFLAPQSHRGSRNEPAFVVEVVKEIAKIKNLTFEKVAFATSKNARGVFGIG